MLSESCADSLNEAVYVQAHTHKHIKLMEGSCFAYAREASEEVRVKPVCLHVNAEAKLLKLHSNINGELLISSL